MSQLKMYLMCAEDQDGTNRDLVIVAHGSDEAMKLMYAYWNAQDDEMKDYEDIILSGLSPNIALLPAVPTQKTPGVIPWEDLYKAARDDATDIRIRMSYAFSELTSDQKQKAIYALERAKARLLSAWKAEKIPNYRKNDLCYDLVIVSDALRSSSSDGLYKACCQCGVTQSLVRFTERLLKLPKRSIP